jgi:hypothetical protein
LFSENPRVLPEPPLPSAVEETLQNVEPDSLSPKEALELIYMLKRLLNKKTEPGA